MDRMRWFKETYLSNEENLNIIDIGSYNVNGCYKELFEEEKYSYTGLDMESGPNVDIVPQSVYRWPEIKNESYEVVISGQAFEHIEFFWETLSEMIRITKKDGLICIIAPNGFEEHRYPVDCWRFFTDGMVAMARYNQLEILHAHTNCAPEIDHKSWYSEKEADSMLVARKPYSGNAKRVDLNTYRFNFADHKKISGGMKTYSEHKAKEKQNEGIEEKKAEKITANNEKSKLKIKIASLVESMSKIVKGVK